MYDDLIHLAMDQQFATAIREHNSMILNYNKLEIWKTLTKKNKSISKLEQNALTFDVVFHEPIGYHLIKCFLQTVPAVDKVIFIGNVEAYKNLQDAKLRKNVSHQIYERFCVPVCQKKGLLLFTNNESSTSLENKNCIEVYGKTIERLKQKLEIADYNINVFDDIVEHVYNDLHLNVFPRFCRSNLYQMYLRCKAVERCYIGIGDFHMMAILRSSKCGFVYACKKKDTRKLYAMKQMKKTTIFSKYSAEYVIKERNILAEMDSLFVIKLHYAFMDESTLYLIVDLMSGGDLKYHLNNDKTFSNDRSVFYAAQILLGLHYMHSKGIVYRGLKLENVLLNDKGHCKISDLASAVKLNHNLTNEYAGTFGYIAPEVILSEYYDHTVDYFSLGVMIYRFLRGEKPFKREINCIHIPQKKQKTQSRWTKILNKIIPQTNANDQKEDKISKHMILGRDTVEMEPEYPEIYFLPAAKSIIKGLLCKNPRQRIGAISIEEIKQHPWFDVIDFGLLEAGYLDPPFVPPVDEINRKPRCEIMQMATKLHKMDEKVKLPRDFDEQLKQFPYVSNQSIQQEIIYVLNCAQLDNPMSFITAEDVKLSEQQNNDEKSIDNNYEISNALVLLVCIATYDQCNNSLLESLKGVNVDQNNIKSLFQKRYKYDLVTNKNDKVTLNDLENLMDETRKLFRNDDYQCLFVIYSGHGTKNTLITSDLKEMSRIKFESYFNGYAVKNKIQIPKIYFVDACRGHYNSEPVDIEYDEKEIIACQTKGTTNIAPNNNRLIFYSNTEPFISYQYEKTGGVLINGLYQVLNDKKNRDKTLIEIQDLIEQFCNNTVCSLKDKNGKITKDKGIVQIETSRVGMDLKMRSNIKFMVNKKKNYKKIKSLNAKNRKYDKFNIVYV
eukprot:79851_1